jgi:hypothetical protein
VAATGVEAGEHGAGGLGHDGSLVVAAGEAADGVAAVEPHDRDKPDLTAEQTTAISVFSAGRAQSPSCRVPHVAAGPQAGGDVMCRRSGRTAVLAAVRQGLFTICGQALELGIQITPRPAAS